MAKVLTFGSFFMMVLMSQSLRIDNNANEKSRFLNITSPFNLNESKKQPLDIGAHIIEGRITQRLDNFDPTNVATWQQQYLMNDEHFQAGGCIFVFLGEWTFNEFRLNDSLMEQMSQELNCLMFFLQHRFYGESTPTPDVSDENLRFLTVEQSLADTAHFIQYVKSGAVTPGTENSPVIIIGGHYSGSLASWFRQTYPSLVIGAWASSAPTLAIADHFQYKELAGAVYRHVGGDECYNNLERGFAEMEQMIADGRNQELADMFVLCNQLEDELDIQMFLSEMAAAFSRIAQYDYVINASELCELIADESIESDAEALARILRMFMGDECLNMDYEYVIGQHRQTSWDAYAVRIGSRQFRYESCTQLGWHHSSSSRFQPFGSRFPVEFMFQSCRDMFGDLFSPELLLSNIDRFNTVHGGLEPAATNVIYVHGQYDPYRSIGVQTTRHPDSPAIIIQGANQSNDLGPLTEEDSDELRAAKLEIKKIISEWIRRSGSV